MDISTSEKHDGMWMWFAGMNSAYVRPDGTFTLLAPAGRNHLGMYMGHDYRGVNTDELFEEGVEVANGQVVEIEIRLEPRRHDPESQ